MVQMRSISGNKRHQHQLYSAHWYLLFVRKWCQQICMKTTKLLKPELSLGLQDQETVRRLLATLSVRGEAFKEDRGGGKEDLLEATWSFCGETHRVEGSVSDHGFVCKITVSDYACNFNDTSPQRQRTWV